MKWTIKFETEHFPRVRYFQGWAYRPAHLIEQAWTFPTKEEAETEMEIVSRYPMEFAGEAILSVVPAE